VGIGLAAARLALATAAVGIGIGQDCLPSCAQVELCLLTTGILLVLPKQLEKYDVGHALRADDEQGQLRDVHVQTQTMSRFGQQTTAVDKVGKFVDRLNYLISK